MNSNWWRYQQIDFHLKRNIVFELNDWCRLNHVYYAKLLSSLQFKSINCKWSGQKKISLIWDSQLGCCHRQFERYLLIWTKGAITEAIQDLLPPDSIKWNIIHWLLINEFMQKNYTSHYQHSSHSILSLFYILFFFSNFLFLLFSFHFVLFHINS